VWTGSTILRVVAVLLLVSLAASCSSSDGDTPATGTSLGPHDSAAEVRPDLITVDSASAQPGSPVSILFPDERIRGIHFVLESHHGDQWNLEYHLISDWGDGREPGIYRAGALEVEIPDIGIGGGGPDVISIPADAAPGDYRLCTGNSRPNICALLTIEPGA